MGEAVAIVGAGQTVHRSRRLDVSAPELIDEAVQAALADARLEPDGIDAVVVGNMEHFEGIHLSDLWSVEGTGAVGKPQLKVATGGTTGSSLAQAGYYLVAGGLFRTVDGPEGSLVLGRGEGYALARNTALGDLDRRIEEIQAALAAEIEELDDVEETDDEDDD